MEGNTNSLTIQITEVGTNRKETRKIRRQSKAAESLCTVLLTAAMKTSKA